ncbi:pentapeptide repeat-containing protein [Nannocystis sp. ILAH1]|uniref:pentapeptide repeat-containing protein n=1 Tax=Nannocystis sp. ILAH1 TaxID=2996789 RepID=UPI00226FB10E|nr:pentapeptide repeat-containing protein [Nannocystis sp. ILAH1]MCY0994777.1 pentapeptide repeat-containing protein [Nannocystis sp. ILAH1]
MANEQRTLPSTVLDLLAQYEAGERGFHYVELEGEDFFGQDLQGVDLRNSKLSSADLHDVDLTDAWLTGADLSSADLRDANLRGASLIDADLRGTNLTGANLAGASFGGASLDGTVLANVDLAGLCDANPPVRHSGPSIVEHSSILRSLRVPGLKDFLVRTGMPEVFVEYMVDCARSLQWDVFKMLQSIFISYGTPDEAFARKLYEALHRNGGDNILLC